MEKTQKIIRREKDGAIMLLIPSGDFFMGDEDGGLNAGTVHEVYLDTFYMDKYPVTHKQYSKFLNEIGNHEEGGSLWTDVNAYNIDSEMGHTPLIKKGDFYMVKQGFENYPVINVSWYGAVAYANWVGGRLPTEAEWEKASRGGLHNKQYPWGNEEPEGRANFGPCGSADNLHLLKEAIRPVGSYTPNGYGLYDMAGNVGEWCHDWYDETYYERSPKENPKGPSSGEDRVFRGGSWCEREYFCKNYARNWKTPEYPSMLVGFRVVLEVN